LAGDPEPGPAAEWYKIVVPSHALTGSQARAVNKAKRLAALRGSLRLLPVLFIVFLFAATMGTGSDEHASRRYYILGYLLTAAATAAVVTLARVGRRFSLAFTRPTPRWLYLLFTTCYTAAASVLYWLTSRRPSGPHGQDWLQMTAGLMGVTCAVAALIMLGRAIARGTFRRVFYFFVPQWLQAPAADVPAETGTGWAAPPRPIVRGRRSTLPPRSSREDVPGCPTER
jgi:hypothetical protein